MDVTFGGSLLSGGRYYRNFTVGKLLCLGLKIINLVLLTLIDSLLALNQSDTF